MGEYNVPGSTVTDKTLLACSPALNRTKSVGASENLFPQLTLWISNAISTPSSSSQMMEEYNVPASTVTYKVLIQSYGDAGQFDMVDELMAFIAEFQHVKLNAFNQLVKTYARASKLNCNYRDPFLL
jgi:hypothetical protein